MNSRYNDYMKFLSINIEGDKHIPRVVEFINSENPDVVCIQEVIADSVPKLEEELGMKSVFAPMVYGLIMTDPRLAGIAIFSKLSLENIKKNYYVGSEDRLEHLNRDSITSSEFHKMINRVVLSADLTVQGVTYTVATTHFTWTPDGMPTDYQLADADKLIEALQPLGELVLAGDFNAPRGLETWSKFTAFLKDNIPEEYDHSLDWNVHRKPGLKFMVDGLFTTPTYIAKDVQLLGNISDHFAILATIEIEK